MLKSYLLNNVRLEVSNIKKNILIIIFVFILPLNNVNATENDIDIDSINENDSSGNDEIIETENLGDDLFEFENGYLEMKEIEELEDLIPPQDIFNIKYDVTENSINFSFDLPIDDDFSHLEIYRDNILIFSDHKLNTFLDINLNSETEYKYIFKSVDLNGNISNGTHIILVTDIEKDIIPPNTPTGLNVFEGNNALFLNWYANSETDLLGYNIYLNGEKYNTDVIKNNNFTLNNLTNDEVYSIQISAIDTSLNESESSMAVHGIPSFDGVPIFSLGTELKDIAESTGAWFSNIWMILAFSISIPLSFFIAGKIKKLIIS